ncbi:hypothetical protein CLV47_12089 [Antricoccus suffuscus]|uniref:Uncharacterized protein n=1 Tax=Antricoccus suffuscus TaxID=1629062 RepID=A0A2T0ZQJ4_9ACTN|nr:hypothetical protein CLV47_12089 [Antricoccus suffuscus]
MNKSGTTINRMPLISIFVAALPGRRMDLSATNGKIRTGLPVPIVPYK